MAEKSEAGAPPGAAAAVGLSSVTTAIPAPWTFVWPSLRRAIRSETEALAMLDSCDDSIDSDGDGIGDPCDNCPLMA